MRYLVSVLSCALAAIAASADVITFGTATVLLGPPTYTEPPWMFVGSSTDIGDEFPADGPDSEAEISAPLFIVGDLELTHSSGSAFDLVSFELESIAFPAGGGAFGMSSSSGAPAVFFTTPGTYTAGIDFLAADYSGITSVDWFTTTVSFGTTTAIIDDITVTAVPEPSTMALSALALVGAIGRRRRR